MQRKVPQGSLKGAEGSGLVAKVTLGNGYMRKRPQIDIGII